MNLFLVPSSSENINRTISSEVDLNFAKKFIDQTDFQKLSDLLGPRGRFHCWAMTESNRTNFERMLAGDLILLSVKGTGQIQFIAKVIYKFESADLGKYLWTYTPNKPWTLVYILADVQKVQIDKCKLVTALGYKPNFEIPGTIFVSPDRIEKAIVSLRLPEWLATEFGVDR